MPPGVDEFSNNSAEAAGEYRRRADQRVEQAIHPVVDDIARRDDDLADAREVIAAQAVEYGAVVAIV
jgi:hypothetical protein